MTTKNRTLFFYALGLAALLATGRMHAQQTAPPLQEDAEHKMTVPGEILWQPGPEALPPGCQVVVLEGDPQKEGVFTMRLKLPADYRIPPHTHPKVERVTVLEGEAKLGMGSQYDEDAMKRLPAGSFFAMPPGMEHFAGTDQGAVIQLTGIGPWQIKYVNPSDDPRQKLPQQLRGLEAGTQEPGRQE